MLEYHYVRIGRLWTKSKIHKPHYCNILRCPISCLSKNCIAYGNWRSRSTEIHHSMVRVLLFHDASVFDGFEWTNENSIPKEKQRQRYRQKTRLLYDKQSWCMAPSHEPVLTDQFMDELWIDLLNVRKVNKNSLSYVLNLREFRALCSVHPSGLVSGGGQN